MSAITSRGRDYGTLCPNFRLEDPDLDPYDLKIALWIASHTDSYREDHVTRNAIARWTGISGERVTKSLNKLAGLLIIRVWDAPNRKGGGGRLVIMFDRDAWNTDCRSPHDQHAGRHTTDAGRHTTDAGRHTTGSIDQQEKTNKSSEVADAPSMPKAQRDEIWDALEASFGKTTNAAERSRRGKTVKLLVESGADGASVRRACAVARGKRWSNYTELAIASHWNELTNGGATQNFEGWD